LTQEDAMTQKEAFAAIADHFDYQRRKAVPATADYVSAERATEAARFLAGQPHGTEEVAAKPAKPAKVARKK
jgi:hypothetical protein